MAVISTVAVISTLFVHVANAKAIESYITQDDEKSKEFKLKSWMYFNYIAFGVAVCFLVAALINYDEKLVIIKGIHQETGKRRSQGVAHAYGTEENLKRVEPAYLIKRNSPQAPKE